MGPRGREFEPRHSDHFCGFGRTNAARQGCFAALFSFRTKKRSALIFQNIDGSNIATFKLASPAFEKSDIALICSVITKIDKKDFSSTRYRYPYKGSKDKPIKQIPLEPVAISITDLVPDLSEGIPWIAIRANQVGVVSKGSKLLCEMKDLFDIIETLFKFSEETDM